MRPTRLRKSFRRKPRRSPHETGRKQQLFDDIVGELKKKGIWEESPEDQLSAEDREALRLGRELLNNPKKKRSAVIHKIFKVWLELLLWRWGCLC